MTPEDPTTTRMRSATLLAALALVGIAVVHLLDGPLSLDDTFYVGALELALAAACVPLAIMLIVAPTRELWAASASLAGLALTFYLLSRTIGLPGATDDIGNWAEPLGIVNLATELALIAIAATALHGQPARATSE